MPQVLLIFFAIEGRRKRAVWFWWFMFVCDILTPALMIGCGRMMWKHPPGSINGLLGYRTPRSMRNMDTWRFAHDHCGRLWWKLGWIMLILSALVCFLFYGRPENVIGTAGGILCLIQCAVLVVSIFPTEKALKKNFTEEGVRK